VIGDRDLDSGSFIALNCLRLQRPVFLFYDSRFFAAHEREDSGMTSVHPIDDVPVDRWNGDPIWHALLVLVGGGHADGKATLRVSL
jgi:hypothetical protein